MSEMYHYEPGLGFYMPVNIPYDQSTLQYHTFAPQGLPAPQEYDGYVLVNPNQGSGWVTDPSDYHPNKVPRFSTPYIPSTTTPPRAPVLPISPVSFVPRQKFKRTATACEECRKKKQKCDGEDPCKACRDLNVTCQYREVPIKKKDQSPERLIELLEHQCKQITVLNERIETMRAALCEQDRRLRMQEMCHRQHVGDNGA